MSTDRLDTSMVIGSGEAFVFEDKDFSTPALNRGRHKKPDLRALRLALLDGKRIDSREVLLLVERLEQELYW